MQEVIFEKLGRAEAAVGVINVINILLLGRDILSDVNKIKISLLK